MKKTMIMPYKRVGLLTAQEVYDRYSGDDRQKLFTTDRMFFEQKVLIRLSEKHFSTKIVKDIISGIEFSNGHDDIFFAPLWPSLTFLVFEDDESVLMWGHAFFYEDGSPDNMVWEVATINLYDDTYEGVPEFLKEKARSADKELIRIRSEEDEQQLERESKKSLKTTFSDFQTVIRDVSMEMISSRDDSFFMRQELLDVRRMQSEKANLGNFGSGSGFGSIEEESTITVTYTGLNKEPETIEKIEFDDDIVVVDII